MGVWWEHQRNTLFTSVGRWHTPGVLAGSSMIVKSDNSVNSQLVAQVWLISLRRDASLTTGLVAEQHTVCDCCLALGAGPAAVALIQPRSGWASLIMRLCSMSSNHMQVIHSRKTEACGAILGQLLPKVLTWSSCQLVFVLIHQMKPGRCWNTYYAKKKHNSFFLPCVIDNEKKSHFHIFILFVYLVYENAVYHSVKNIRSKSWRMCYKKDPQKTFAWYIYFLCDVK